MSNEQRRHSLNSASGSEDEWSLVDIQNEGSYATDSLGSAPSKAHSDLPPSEARDESNQSAATRVTTSIESGQLTSRSKPSIDPEDLCRFLKVNIEKVIPSTGRCLGSLVNPPFPGSEIEVQGAAGVVVNPSAENCDTGFCFAELTRLIHGDRASIDCMIFVFGIAKGDPLAGIIKVSGSE
jgi:hypothetical protein